MLPLLFAVLQLFTAPADRGLFETAGLYLVRVTAVEVPDHPRLLGKNKLRLDEIVIGPAALKGTTSVYEFFRPSGELRRPSGGRYSGYYPHFAYPAPKGQLRYWWAESDGAGGWKTADSARWANSSDPGLETLLKADLKPDSPEAKAQAELVAALIQLEAKRTRLDQFAYLRELQDSKTKPVYLMADRIVNTLTAPPRPRPSPPPANDKPGTPPPRIIPPARP